MSRLHRQLVLLLLILVGVAAALQLWPLRAGSFPGCAFPAVVEQAGQAQVFCLAGPSAELAAVAGPRLGQCPARGRLRAGKQLLLAPDCRRSWQEIPGALRLILDLPIELNRAQTADLIALPGVGEVLASRIVAERARRGPFCQLRELQRVRGIGPVMLRRLAPYLQVSPPCRAPSVPDGAPGSFGPASDRSSGP